MERRLGRVKHGHRPGYGILCPHPDLWLPHNLEASVRRNKPLRGVLSPQAGEGDELAW